MIFFTKKTVLTFRANCLSIGDNLHEMTKPVFWEKQEKYFKLSSAENYTQNAKVSFILTYWFELLISEINIPL